MEWVSRCLLESLQYECSTFVTLTYSVPPEFNSLSKSDWRLLTKGVGFRYFGCGEYGERMGRPHYHLLVFGQRPEDAQEFWSRRWKKGFIHVAPFSRATAMYVCGYVTKKMNRPTDQRLMPGQIPEFLRMSRRPGIGALAVRRFGPLLTSPGAFEYVAQNLDVPAVVRIDGKVFGIGRTLRRHLRESAGVVDKSARRELFASLRSQLKRLHRAGTAQPAHDIRVPLKGCL